MPMYEYRCRRCGEGFERIVAIGQRDRKGAVACPKCAATDVERRASRVAVGTTSKGWHRAEPLDV